jgi:hypothetical protein
LGNLPRESSAAINEVQQFSLTAKRLADIFN